MAESLSNPEKQATCSVVLQEYDVFDATPDSALDELTRLAAQVCSTPFAFTSFFDAQRQWFKARVGLDVTDAPREGSFCSQAVLQDGLFIVEDAHNDTRFVHYPLVTSGPMVRFYAGVRLASADGAVLGTVSVLDRAPRQLDANQAQMLQILARQISSQVELRRRSAELARTVEALNSTADRLRQSEAFYSTLVETLPQNILRKDAQGRFTFANRRFCSLLGKPLDEILGKTDFDLFPPEMAAKFHRDDLAVMQTLKILDTVEAHQTSTGEKLFVHVIKTPLYDSVGRVAGIQGIFWDVTNRKRTEEALAYERDLLRALLENIPDRIYFKDIESRFLRCSASMIKRLGAATQEDVIGKTDFDFHAAELAREFHQDEERIILTGQPLVNKLERQFSAEGAEMWASVTKVPVYSQAGGVNGIIGISRDVTQLKQAELALEHARDAALESARVKSEFLANMSHEIRTPMNAITGMTGLLLDTRLSAEQRDYVETIRTSTDALLTVVNDVLDFSKIEAGKVSLELIDFDLRDTIETTIEMLAERAQKKSLELGCWIDAGVPNLLRGDPGRVRQILANLLSNAVKFTEKGEVLVRVTRDSPIGAEGARESSPITVKIAVQDTGVGIASDALSMIFDAFTQADGSTTRRFGGTGLGLTISRKLVKMMNGEIGVDSTLGQGSTFWFKLPFAHPTTAATAAPQLPEIAGKRVLVVDDTTSARHILHEQLERLKVLDFYAGSGSEAMTLLRGHAAAGTPFDLALIDIELAETDGLTLAQSIQADSALRAIRLIMVTPLSRRLSTTVLQTSGIAACLVKPLRQARLFDSLVDVLRADRSPFLSERPARLPVPLAEVKDVRVLVAEDNIVNQRLVLRQLKKLGYYADAVADGKEVLHALRQVPYDIILMDCQMPEMDGYEVTREIRRERGTAGTARPYIIALTASALQGDRERCLHSGMNDYLTKPLKMSDLESSLQRALLRVQPATRQRGARSSSEVLDLGILAGLRELGGSHQPDPLQELVDLFLKDAHLRMQKLASSLAARDWGTVASTAHTFKGSANNLGARQLAGLLADLEKQAKAANPTDSANLLQPVCSEFHDVEAALLAELRTNSPGA